MCLPNMENHMMSCLLLGTTESHDFSTSYYEYTIATCPAFYWDISNQGCKMLVIYRIIVIIVNNSNATSF